MTTPAGGHNTPDRASDRYGQQILGVHALIALAAAGDSGTVRITDLWRVIGRLPEPNSVTGWAGQGKLGELITSIVQQHGDPGTDTEYTSREVSTTGVTEGWADTETDPAAIYWPDRQAAAAIPFTVKDGRPVSPFAPAGIRYGRNEFGRWGEQKMADAIVLAWFAGCRHLLMIRRGDSYGWAVPGGHVEPGESPAEAAARKLAEETGLRYPASMGLVTSPQHVPDPRASDEAWAVTFPVIFDLSTVAKLPAVTGADDAADAAWIQAGVCSDLDRLDVFPAHTSMLQRLLAGDVNGE